MVLKMDYPLTEIIYRSIRVNQKQMFKVSAEVAVIGVIAYLLQLVLKNYTLIDLEVIAVMAHLLQLKY